MMRKFTILCLVLFTILYAEDKNKTHEFTMKSKIPATEVKSQDKTGTCWAFATTSFIESELLRMNKGNYDLSEMFIVRNAYSFKSEKYFRYHGDYNIEQGGQAHDYLAEFDAHGVIPENVYSGKVNGEEKHNHTEYQGVIKGIMDAVVKKKTLQNKTLWTELIESASDIYLGKVPETFEYEGKTYTPVQFKEHLGIISRDYVEITSFNYHPYYQAVDLEIPDNYRHALYYNVPLDDLIQIMDAALNNGYSLVWDGSVDKENFFSKKGYGVVPADDWNKDSTKVEKEKIVTEELRQQYFDAYKVVDDHLIHLTGIAEDQNGTKFYYMKNSWGTEKGFDGYYYLSEQYMRLRTIALMVHKDALPFEIKSKLGL